MRAGLTGLGLVFVATLGASMIFGPETAVEQKKVEEPLAQLGVAPGPDRQEPAHSAAPVPHAETLAPAPAAGTRLMPEEQRSAQEQTLPARESPVAPTSI